MKEICGDFKSRGVVTGESPDKGAAEGSGSTRHKDSLFVHFCGFVSLQPHFQDMVIWLNGRLVAEGTLDALSAGATLGWGVFTTVGIQEGSPRFLRRHFERLKRDAAQALLAFEVDFETITQGLAAVLEANGIQEGLARLTLTQRGDGRWSTDAGSDLSIAAIESEFQTSPMRVQLSPFRVEARRPLAGVKTTSYLPYLWAWREAKDHGFDEAILRDGSEFLSEGARANLFWVQDNQLFTPSLLTGCLRGLGRELVLEWSQTQALKVGKGRFPIDDLQNADEVWLVSAVVGPRPVAALYDEAGGLLREFAEPWKVGAELSAWWDGLALAEAV